MSKGPMLVVLAIAACDATGDTRINPRASEKALEEARAELRAAKDELEDERRKRHAMTFRERFGEDEYRPRADGILPTCRVRGTEIPLDWCWVDDLHRGRCTDRNPYCKYPREYGLLPSCPLWLLDREDRREMQRGADGLSCLGSDRTLVDQFAVIDVSRARGDLVCDDNGDPVCMITKESF